MNKREFLARAALASGGFSMHRCAGATTVAKQHSLLKWLTPAERAAVASGFVPRQLTDRVARAIGEVADGDVLDCTMLRGTIDLEEDVFGRRPYRPITLRTAGVSFRRDLNAGNLMLPGGLRWEMAGTRIVASQPPRLIPSDNAVAYGLIETFVGPGTCHGDAGTRELRLIYPSQAAYFRPGARVAIFGIEPDPNLEHSLRAPVAADARTLPLAGNTAATIEGGVLHLLIGDEIVYGSVSRGLFTAVGPDGRGRFGTRAGAHAAGAVATAMRSAILTVDRVVGSTVLLTEPLPRSFRNAIYRVGSMAGGLSGSFEIAGATRRNGSEAPFHCLAATLASGFEVTGTGRLSGGPHGGFIAYGADGMRVQLDRISGCGRPEVSLGSSIWIFGRARRNHVAVKEVSDGHAAWAIDDKSFGMSYYGLEGSSQGNEIAIDQVTAHDLEGQLTGGVDNRVTIGRADTRKGSVIMDAGRSQSVRPVATRGNVVRTARRQNVFAPAGDALSGNLVSGSD